MMMGGNARKGFEVNAYAKINISLDILGKRPDGYHEMDMVMQCVSLCDILTAEKAANTSLYIDEEGYGSVLSASDNLVLKAHRALENFTEKKLPCAFRLHKRIPVAAGLGGGSADAAAALICVNGLYELDVNEENLLRIGAKIGADIPFCLAGRKGGVYRATGIGTELSALNFSFSPFAIIIQPCEGLSTAEVFAGYAASENRVHPNTGGVISAMRSGDLRLLRDCGGNALQPVAEKMRGEIGDCIRAIYLEGAQYAAMSGSGPSVFGLFSERGQAGEAFCRLKTSYPQCYLCKLI